MLCVLWQVLRTDRDREVTELVMDARSLHEDSDNFEQGSALQTWPTCICCLHRQSAKTSELSLPVPIGPFSFFYSIIARGEEETLATQLTGSSPVLEGRAFVHRLQCITIGDISCDLQEALW